MARAKPGLSFAYSKLSRPTIIKPNQNDPLKWPVCYPAWCLCIWCIIFPSQGWQNKAIKHQTVNRWKINTFLTKGWKMSRFSATHFNLLDINFFISFSAWNFDFWPLSWKVSNLMWPGTKGNKHAIHFSLSQEAENEENIKLFCHFSSVGPSEVRATSEAT